MSWLSIIVLAFGCTYLAALWKQAWDINHLMH